MSRKSRHLSASVSQDLYDWVVSQAKASGMSVNFWVNLQLSLLREGETLARIERLERRVGLLEATPYGNK